MSEAEPLSSDQAVEAPLALPELMFSARHSAPRDVGDMRQTELRPVVLLARALEQAVIPRLALARASVGQRGAVDARTVGHPDTEVVELLAQHALKGDLDAALQVIEGLQARGCTLEQIYLELLAPAARHLGDLWADDLCDFASVTVGLCCLQQAVLESRRFFAPRQVRREGGRRILLAPVPGEQHGFGLLMVGEFFRRSGWDVCSGTGAASRELVATVRKQWFSMVGFSIACDSRLDVLAALIRDVRRSSRNPHVGVLVGGQLFNEQPELAALVGADATASDAQQAVLKAETLAALLNQDV